MRPAWRPLFAQVEYFRLMFLAKQDPQKFLPEATAWLKNNTRFKQTEGYQGVSLEVAKALLSNAARAATREKMKLNAEAIRMLNDMVKVASRHQQEAIRLLHDLQLASSQAKTGPGKTPGKTDATTFDEAVVMGDACKTTAEWDKALEWYRLAEKLVAKAAVKDQAAHRRGPRVDQLRATHARPRIVQQGQVERLHRTGRQDGARRPGQREERQHGGRPGRRRGRDRGPETST